MNNSIEDLEKIISELKQEILENKLKCEIVNTKKRATSKEYYQNTVKNNPQTESMKRAKAKYYQNKTKISNNAKKAEKKQNLESIL